MPPFSRKCARKQNIFTTNYFQMNQSILACLLFFLPVIGFAQLTGKVLDENGEPLPYASVYVRNTSKGVAANANGEFRLLLDKGSYNVVFQYVGYKQHIERVEIGDKPLRVTVRMEPNILELGEVVITDADPAERIMRQVIAKRRYYKSRVPEYVCDVYIKGFHKLLDAPKKIMGQDIGNMGGILDSNRTGVLYLSESVSKLYVQASPERKKEIMVSSKISGNENGFSLNRATLTEFNLYDERLEINREILSPLADNAFNFYNFRLMGRYKDENGYDIYKIAVKPKSTYDPAFGGFLYVVDEWWNLSGFDLFLTGKSIREPVLDTLVIKQEFIPLERPDKWMPLSQVLTFKFSVLGFKVSGFFGSMFSEYNIQPVYAKGFFDREVFKIDQNASERDSTYWAAIRPTPLTQEERRDYVRKDSLSKIWESKAFMDSIDRKNNRFKPFDLLFGYDWNNSYKKISIDWPPAFKWIQFNTVQGLALNIQPVFMKQTGKRAVKFWQATGTLNYGFSEQRLRGGLRVVRRFESIHYTQLEVDGGVLSEQIAENRPISALLNSAYSLFSQRNYLKLYEKTFFRFNFARNVTPGIRLFVGGEFDDRRPLVNTTDYTWYKGDNRAYTPNDLRVNDQLLEPVFEQPHQAFILQASARFRFGQQYLSYPDFRINDEVKWPELLLQYRKAIAGVGGSDADYDFVRAELRQSNLNLGLSGYAAWNLSAGTFINRNNVPLVDLYHPIGNQTIFGDPSKYGTSFLMMPYFANSTNRFFVEAHWQHHFQGWLLDKIPGIRRLNMKEVLTLNFFHTERAVSDQQEQSREPYWELGFGFENIGFKVFRPLRFDVVNSFKGGKYHSTGVVIGIDL